MAAKGGIWTKNGFVKAVNRKDNGGTVAVATDDNDPATRLNSNVSTNKDEQEEIAREAGKLYNEGVEIYRNLDDDDRKALLGDNIAILDDIESKLRRPNSPNKAGVIVKDKNGNIQAVAAIEYHNDSIYVNLLATNPKNMDRDSPDAVKGGGTQAIARIAKLAQERGVNKVELSPLENAIPFYKKLGFKNKFIYFTLEGEALDKLAAKAR